MAYSTVLVAQHYASGTEFNQFMQQRVFEPLKMQATEVDVPEKVTLHRTQFYRKTHAGVIQNAPQVNNEFKVAGGGFLSTTEDLLRFGNEILKPTLLSKQTRDDLIQPLLTKDGQSTDYAVCFQVVQTDFKHLMIGHGGGSMGGTAMLMMFPQQQIVIAVLTNASSVPLRQILPQLEEIFVGS